MRTVIIIAFSFIKIVFSSLSGNGFDGELDLYDHYGCDGITKKHGSLLYKNTTWNLIREAYNEVIDERKSGFNISSNVILNGFKVKYNVNTNSNNERSLFTNERINKGQLIYEHVFVKNFTDSKSYRNFLDKIPTDMACDLIDLAYYESDDSDIVTIDFDDIAFCGGCTGTNCKPNIGHDSDKNDFQQFALRDIEVGEELICSDWEYEDSDDDKKVENEVAIISDLNKCDAVLATKRPIFKKSTWILLQNIYEDVVGLSNSTITDSSVNFNGISVNYFVNYTKDKGRGLFAGENIRKGQALYEHKRLGYFHQSDHFLEFLNRLILQEYNYKTKKHQDDELSLDHLISFAPGLVCDVIKFWIYGDYESSMWMMDFDDGNYCNTETQNEINVDYDAEDPEQKRMIALRDIKKGEELLCHYEY